MFKFLPLLFILLCALAAGGDLGVIGAARTAPGHLTTVQPAIVSSTVQLGWGDQGRNLDHCEIQVDRGSGYTLLTYDSTPNYTDTAAHPATPTKWKYKAIYRVDDAQVGLWSAEVSVVVGARQIIPPSGRPISCWSPFFSSSPPQTPPVFHD